MFASQVELNDPIARKRARKINRAAWRSLLAARLRLSVHSFSRVYPRLGKLMSESPQATPEGRDELVIGIAEAIEKMRWYLPWKSNCLVRAVAAHQLLARHELHHTLYIGMGKVRGEGFRAHAWLRCGSYVVTGDSALDQYAIIASFGAGQIGGETTSKGSEAGLQRIAAADFTT